jgi:hypothetical protein
MRPKQTKPITFQGVSYPTRRKLAAHLGISESTLSVAANKVAPENLESHLEEYYKSGRKRCGPLTWKIEGKDGRSETRTLAFWCNYFRCHQSKLHRLHTHYVQQGSERPTHDTLVHCARDHRNQKLRASTQHHPRVFSGDLAAHSMRRCVCHFSASVLMAGMLALVCAL